MEKIIIKPQIHTNIKIDENIINIEPIIKPIFKNQRVFIIGGGPSLSNFNWNLLKDKNIIAINKAGEYLPFAQILYFSDLSFYINNKPLIRKFKNLIYTIKQLNDEDSKKVISLKVTGLNGLELQNGSLRHGNNSGYAAINLAVQLGANEIILMGYDMSHDSTKSHFHEGYTYCKADPNIYKKKFIDNFFTLVDPLKKMGIKIYNTSINSALTCFPIVSINNFL